MGYTVTNGVSMSILVLCQVCSEEGDEFLKTRQFGLFTISLSLISTLTDY